MPITFKRAGQEAVTLENVSFKGVALDKVTFKRAGQEAVTVFEKAAADALAGTWVFNDAITLDSAQSFSLVFISGGIQGTSISIEENFGLFSLYYTWENSNVTQAFTGGQWTDTTYKTITITSNLSEVTNGDQLLAWLQANATKQT